MTAKCCVCEIQQDGEVPGLPLTLFSSSTPPSIPLSFISPFRALTPFARANQPFFPSACQNHHSESPLLYSFSLVFSFSIRTFSCVCLCRCVGAQGAARHLLFKKIKNLPSLYSLGDDVDKDTGRLFLVLNSLRFFSLSSSVENVCRVWRERSVGGLECKGWRG